MHDERWMLVVKERAITDLEKAPNYILEHITKAASVVLQHFPDITELWLVGSYAKGTFRDEQTERSLHEWLLSKGVKEAYSDVDFVSIPCKVVYNFLNKEIDIIGCPESYNKKTLIYRK